MTARTVGPYRLEEQIGSGGMGTVWRATVEGAVPGVPVGERVAVKVVHPHLAIDDDVFERFVREAAIGRAIRHENVVRTLDAGMDVTDDGIVVYLAMEHVVGRTLAALREGGPVSEGFCRRVAREVARGLAAIHDRGVVHGDVKPENVLLTRDEVVKVMDLGLARLRDRSLRRGDDGRFSGSLLYAAPEQFGRRQDAIDGRVDLFALGVTLYELAAGRHPWFAPGEAAFVPRQAEVDAPPLAGVRPDVSEFLAAVVHALLARDPDRRIRSAAELAAVLAGAEDGPWFRARRAAMDTASASADPVPHAARLHGREQELADLWGALRRVAPSDSASTPARGAVAVVEGERGAGATRLLAALAEAAASTGVPLRTLRRGFGGGRTGADVVAGAESDVAARAFSPQPNLAASGPRPAGSSRLAKIRVDGIADAATLLVLDHVEAADDEGWRGVVRLLHAASATATLVVLTSAEPLPLARSDDLPAGAVRVTLSPLSEDATFSLAADVLLAGRPSAPFVRTLAERSGGNPGVALAWVRDLVADRALRMGDDGAWDVAAAAAPHPVPRDVLAWGEAALVGVAQDDRDLLDACACAGRAIDPALVAAATGSTARDVEARLGALARRGLVRRTDDGRWEIAARAVAEALAAAVPESLAIEYHRAFADVFAAAESRSPAESAELVLHLVAAGAESLPPDDVRRALAHLDVAGRPDAVLAVADAVLRTGAASEVAAEVQIRRARALLASGRAAEARIALGDAIAAGTG